MKNILIIIATLMCLQSTAQSGKTGIKQFVYDNEKDFTQSQTDSLHKLLEAHYKKTGDVIAVVTTDSTGGGDTDIFIDHFGMDSLRVRGDKLNSMIIFLSVKEKNFILFPDKKLQPILTHEVLKGLVESGYSELKAHRFFEGIWKLCKAVVEYLQKQENSD